MRSQIARNSIFNAGETSRLMQTAANVGAFFGEDATKGLDRLEQAARGGAEGMAKLAFDVGAVSRETAQLAIDAGAAGDGFDKMREMAAGLETHLQGYAERNVDPITKGAKQLQADWQNLLVSLGNTVNIEGLVVGAMSGIGAAVDNVRGRVETLRNLMSGNWGALSTAVPYDTAAREETMRAAANAGRWAPSTLTTSWGTGLTAGLTPTATSTSALGLSADLTNPLFNAPLTASPKTQNFSGGGGSSRARGGGSSRALADSNRGLTDFGGGGEAEAEADLRAETAQLERQLVLVQQETALQGQSAAHIDMQLSLLKARQEVEKSGLDTTNATAASYLKSAEALAAGRLQLEQSQLESRRWEDAIRGVANTIENTLGNTIEDIFSGRRITDWGAQLKSVVGSVLSDIVKFTLIRPAIGQPLGFGEIGQFGELS